MLSTAGAGGAAFSTGVLGPQGTPAFSPERRLLPSVPVRFSGLCVALVGEGRAGCQGESPGDVPSCACPPLLDSSPSQKAARALGLSPEESGGPRPLPRPRKGVRHDPVCLQQLSACWPQTGSHQDVPQQVTDKQTGPARRWRVIQSHRETSSPPRRDAEETSMHMTQGKRQSEKATCCAVPTP